MLDSLITSKTRIKLITKFFLNPETRSYLRSLADEFGESTNAVRLELNRLEESGLLSTEKKGRTILYKANTNNPLFPELNTIVRKTLGIDKLAEAIAEHIGDLRMVFITGDYAKGIDSGLIDLVLVGEGLDQEYLAFLVGKTEEVIKRKVRPLVLSREEFHNLKEKLDVEKALILWGSVD